MSKRQVELQAVIAQELLRLSETAKDVETHLEDALGSETLQETTITGIQQIDQIAQILEHLSDLFSRASNLCPIDDGDAAVLLDVIQLTSLQHRLQGKDHGDLPPPSPQPGIELF